jgi:hypothetical protein
MPDAGFVQGHNAWSPDGPTFGSPQQLAADEFANEFCLRRRC